MTGLEESLVEVSDQDRAALGRLELNSDDTIEVVKTDDGKWMIGDLGYFSPAGEWLKHRRRYYWDHSTTRQDWIEGSSLVKQTRDEYVYDVSDYREVVTFGHNMFLYQEKEVYTWKSDTENDPSYSYTHRVTAWFERI